MTSCHLVVSNNLRSFTKPNFKKWPFQASLINANYVNDFKESRRATFLVGEEMLLKPPSPKYFSTYR